MITEDTFHATSLYLSLIIVYVLIIQVAAQYGRVCVNRTSGLSSYMIKWQVYGYTSRQTCSYIILPWSSKSSGSHHASPNISLNPQQHFYQHCPLDIYQVPCQIQSSRIYHYSFSRSGHSSILHIAGFKGFQDTPPRISNHTAYYSCLAKYQLCRFQFSSNLEASKIDI